MINFSEEGMKTSFKIILNTQGIIIKEKGFFGTSYKDVYSKRYTDISSIKLDNKVLVYTLTFDNRTTEYFDKEIDARKIKMLCELGKTNPNELLRQIGSDNDNKQLSEFSVKELEDLVDRNKFAAASSTKKTSFMEDADDLQYTFDGISMVFKEGETSVDDNQKDSFPKNVERIVFPSSLEMLYENDFPQGMPRLHTLDFSSAINLTTIYDDCFHDCPNLKVVVLPPYLESIPRFKNCDNLIEIHVPKSLKNLFEITGDADNRITAYISNAELEFDEDFCNDCRQVFVPSENVEEWREEAEEADVDVIIEALPPQYKYPRTALSTPWEKENNRVQVHYSQRDTDTDSYPQKPQAKEPSAPSCPPPIPTFSYYAIIEGQQRGPYNKEQFKRLVDADLITANTMIWCEGMGGWQKACEVDDMRVFFNKQATPPVSPCNGGCPPPPPCC